LLETLQKQIGELIGGPPEEKQQFKKTVADRLKELTEGVTSGTPDRAWYSVSSRGLLEAAKFVKDLSAEMRHAEESRHHLLAGFLVAGHLSLISRADPAFSELRLTSICPFHLAVENYP
jgi:hypothetical protein